ncbi:MAG: hypothetical protein JWM41_3811 [Gemmatimonadetes bacterium]|nr:hypothetical protein [Gemmatimonadota bacterium]
MTANAPLTSPNKLDNAPLVHTVAQVRFSPDLKISEAVPNIQGDLKGIGFPRFEKSEVSNIDLSSGVPKLDQLDRWDFLTRDKKTGVALTRDFVVLQTSAYDTFAIFGDLLRQVLEILAKYARIDVVERLGIRYVDLVRRQKDESFKDYLKPGLVGFPFDEVHGEEIIESFSAVQSVAKLADSALTIRCLQANNGQFLPPDLAPTGLHYEVVLEKGELVAIIDSDHYAMVDMDFGPKAIIERLDSLHQLANKAFRSAVTSHALKQWGAINVQSV